MEYTTCGYCFESIENSCLAEGEVDGITLTRCPVCGGVLSAKAEAAAYAQFLPTADQCTYTIHCLQKQRDKLKNALNQVEDTITKLDILRELAKEKEKEL